MQQKTKNKKQNNGKGKLHLLSHVYSSLAMDMLMVVLPLVN